MKKTGVGMSLVLHPTGRKGGGDPSQAIIQLKPDGSLFLKVGAVDHGQGALTILRQVAAEAMDVDIATIYASNRSDDLAPLSAGSAASRVSLVDPHAVVAAAQDLKTKIAALAARHLEVEADEVEVADGRAYARGNPHHHLSFRDVGMIANLGEGAILVGTGAWQPARVQGHDPQTGRLDQESIISFGCCVAEVVVDTDTGEVEVTKLVQVWEVGKAINPLMVRQQINGGLQIGLGFALRENLFPNYPDPDPGVESLGDYAMPTFEDYPPELIHGIEEVPHPMGVKGAKGFAEGSTSGPPPAIISAIHDAIGVWIHEVPATAEVVLRALEAKERQGAADYWSHQGRGAWLP
jgi:CO/xanthine dehydrogenase Mo-binding subunit